MSPLKQSTNIAARMGRWSAKHRKTAIFGWLAFVVASFAIGSAVGMKTIDQNDINVGEARTADHIIRDAGFKLDEQMEYVLVQSPTQTAADPAFRAVVDQAIAKLETFPKVTKLRSPLAKGNEGQISEDGHAVLIQFSPKGTYDEATAYIDTIIAGHRAGAEGEPRLHRRQAGSASTGKALDEMFSSQLARAGMISIPITLVILLLVFGSLVGAADPARARPHRRVRDDGPRRPAEPDRADGRVDLRGHPPDRPRGRRRLLALLHPPRAGRATGRTQRVRSARGGRRDVRPGRAHLGHHRDDRDGRHVLLRRQDVHVVRDRDDDGRRRRDDRLAHRPAGDALVARRPGRQGARPVPRPAQARRRREPPLGRDPRRRPPPPARLGDRAPRPCSSRWRSRR